VESCQERAGPLLTTISRLVGSEKRPQAQPAAPAVEGGARMVVAGNCMGSIFMMLFSTHVARLLALANAGSCVKPFLSRDG
jgi:hypothetical protein